MADQVEEIKAKTDIVSVISEFIDLKKAGRNYKASCPFHGEKTPSFMVSPELQIFKCFGCGESGDVISFLQKFDGMDFVEALKFLADRVGIELKPLQGRTKSFAEKIFEINYLAARFYNYVLLNHSAGKEALKYLTTDRGLKISTIKTFQLGFSPNKPFAIKKFLVDRKKMNIPDLEKAGLVYTSHDQVFDRFRGRVIFPLYDHRGNVAGFAGRILPKDTVKDLAKYINSPETDAYHKSKILYGLNLVKDAIKKKKLAVVVEGELDMISSWQAGITNTVAIKGSSLTAEQVKLLSRFANSAVLTLDADVAGSIAARRGIEIADAQGFEVKVAQLGKDYKDPDEMARSDPEGLKAAIANAKGAWDFIVDSIFAKYSVATGAAKAKISKEIVPLLSSISDQIVQAHYIEKVAKRLNVPVTAVINEVSKFDKSTKTTPPVNTPALQEVKKDRREILEERLLAIAFRFNPTILSQKKVNSLIVSPLLKRIVEVYISYTKKKKEFDPSDFASHLAPELVEGFTDLVLKETGDLEIENQDEFKQEIALLQKELETSDVKSKLEQIAQLISELETAKKGKKLKRAKTEFGKLTKKLSVLEAKEFKGIIL